MNVVWICNVAELCGLALVLFGVAGWSWQAACVLAGLAVLGAGMAGDYLRGRRKGEG